MPSPPPYRIIYEDEIKQANWSGLDFKASQIVMRYDADLRTRSGLIVTTIREKDLRQISGSRRGRLYIKADTPDYGLWELTMLNVLIQEQERENLWFHHEGGSRLIILRPVVKRR